MKRKYEVHTMKKDIAKLRKKTRISEPLAMPRKQKRVSRPASSQLVKKEKPRPKASGKKEIKKKTFDKKPGAPLPSEPV